MKQAQDKWKGRVALVTGASSGIGRSTAVALARVGMRVAVTGRSEERLADTARQICDAGAEALTLTGNLTEPATPAKLFRQLQETWDTPDVLINNAGVGGGRKFLEADAETVDTCFEINLSAAARCIREAITAMQNKKEAIIVNVSSLASYRLVPGRGSPAYSASKHALRALTEGIRGELAASKGRIKLCTISPGLVDTEFHDNIEAFGYRPLSPEDVAEAIVYILSTPPHVVIQDLLIKSIEQVV